MLSDHVDSLLFSDREFEAFDLVIDTGEIGISDFQAWSFQYDVVELCTAVKGHCFRYLRKAGFTKIVYLDPDIACFSSLDFLFSALNSSSILLTPHQLTPARSDAEIIDNELCSHKHGIFNLGFLGVGNAKESDEFVEWWAKRLHSYCRDDIPNGMFTDQKWCDAVPSYFQDYQVIRHPGCNVASWNLAERQLYIDNDKMLVNGHPLVFYHFTKYFKEGVPMTKKYAASLDAVAVWNWYGRQIAEIRNTMPEPAAQGKYCLYASGHTIDRGERLHFRQKLIANPSLIKSNPYESKFAAL